MPNPIRLESTPRTSDGSGGVTAPAGSGGLAALVERQGGVISRAQLLDCGLSTAGLARWIRSGRLQRVHPGVYALGHRAFRIEARLVAALLYAGPGAVLSHTTAAWWWRILETEPRRIHLSGHGRRRSLPEICVHRPRHPAGTNHRGLPVTPIARTLLDLAMRMPRPALRRALAEADHRRLLDIDAVTAALGGRHPGTVALRAALAAHNPRLARTLSALEERFLVLCETANVPQPEVNARVVGLTVDALWRRQRLVVELDGHASHARPAVVERDRGRDLTLRAAGYLTLRYTWQQLTEHPDLVLADLRSAPSRSGISTDPSATARL